MHDTVENAYANDDVLLCLNRSLGKGNGGIFVIIQNKMTFSCCLCSTVSACMSAVT